jgi:pimeloyl-ACP methyl ester carboxylesterase
VTALPDWIASQLPSGFLERDVAVGDERMHVLEWGPSNGHPIVFVHGNPTWSFLWRKVIAKILARPDGDRYRLIAVDLIGLGQSSKPRGAVHTISNHGAWLGAALDAIAPGPVVLVAQDWGGPIALAAMRARPERFRGLVLGNTAVSPPGPKFKATVFHQLSQTPILSDLLFRGLGFPLRVLHTSQGDRSTIRGKVARAYRWPLRRFADRNAPLALARMVPNGHDHVSVPALEQIDHLFRTTNAPISIVWGTKDPILGKVISHLEKLRPDAKVVRTRAGHFLQEEVPDELAEATLDLAGRADWS